MGAVQAEHVDRTAPTCGTVQAVGRGSWLTAWSRPLGLTIEGSLRHLVAGIGVDDPARPLPVVVGPASLEDSPLDLLQRLLDVPYLQT